WHSLKTGFQNPIQISTHTNGRAPIASNQSAPPMDLRPIDSIIAYTNIYSAVKSILIRATRRAVVPMPSINKCVATFEYLYIVIFDICFRAVWPRPSKIRTMPPSKDYRISEPSRLIPAGHLESDFIVIIDR